MSNSQFILEAGADDFQAKVIEASRQRPVLVDFWADWCQPCKMLMPVLAKLAQEYAGAFLLVKVNTEQEQELAMQFGIRSIPTLHLYKQGELVEQVAGALPEAQLRALLDQHIERESDRMLRQAFDAMAQGDTGTAAERIEQVNREDPGNPLLPLAQAELLLETGQADQARTRLEALKPDLKDQPDAKRLSYRIHLAEVISPEQTTETLQQRVTEHPDDKEALYQLALHHSADGRYPEAMERLLELFRLDRERAKEELLLLFGQLGADHPLVPGYRQKLFSLMH